MKIDLHGVKLEDLPKELDHAIHQAIMENEAEIEFITGTGPLQNALFFRVRTVYDYPIKRKLNNSGTLIVTLE